MASEKLVLLQFLFLMGFLMGGRAMIIWVLELTVVSGLKDPGLRTLETRDQRFHRSNPIS